MTKRFIAIGVGQGDAFFFQRENFTVLVDGGRSVHGFPLQFQRAVKRNGVDVVVCTHNDADHVNGVLGFLKSGLKCREIWLPADWTDRLEDLITRPKEFLIELVENVSELRWEINGFSRVLSTRVSTLQTVGDYYYEDITNGGEQACKEPCGEEEEIGNCITKAFEEERESDIDYWEETWMGDWARLSLCLWPYWIPMESWYARLFFEAIAAGNRIRAIVREAFHRGVRIRWFQYHATQGGSGGIPGTLIPLNAREVSALPTWKRSALWFLALTTANKRSLVFYSPDADDGPGVLFSADSDLSFSEAIPWHSGMIITTPHHGAESNASAYQRFRNETRFDLPVIWVRSDGKYKNRPGPSYLGVSGRRFCTICRGSSIPKQNVYLVLQKGNWQPVATRKCHCR
jgi:hypothetical protein